MGALFVVNGIPEAALQRLPARREARADRVGTGPSRAADRAVRSGIRPGICRGHGGKGHLGVVEEGHGVCVTSVTDDP